MREAKQGQIPARVCPAYEYAAEIGALFREYTDMLIEKAPSFRSYLEIQDYGEELRHLEEKYGPPYGRLYLAFCGGEPAGCIGLRKMDEENCEMKRLYVRPAYRGMHIGRRLVEKILEDAREIGYRHMFLDTLPFLQSAVRMYREYGFYEIPRYNDCPMESCIYMKLDLPE